MNDMEVYIKPYTLNFTQPAGTSRGVYSTRKSWFVAVKDGNLQGVGECAPLPNLSCDATDDYEQKLEQSCKELVEQGVVNHEKLRGLPSILFGLETALQDLKAKNHILWPTSFTKGEVGLPINGLIWMGTHQQMLRQIEEKVAKGFKCLKLKVGAIDFDQELDLVRRIRQQFTISDLEIRLDANGGFEPDKALALLDKLAKYQIHSIEQPIKAGLVEQMATIVKQTPIPIALDEELIGINQQKTKEELLDSINPHYIILKPSLHGGLAGSTEWIEIAQKQKIGWWITSALESNVGLNAIAQWCASLKTTMPQGLGTGMLFTNNVKSPLYIDGQELKYTPDGEWDLADILREMKRVE